MRRTETFYLVDATDMAAMRVAQKIQRARDNEIVELDPEEWLALRAGKVQQMTHVTENDAH